MGVWRKMGRVGKKADGMNHVGLKIVQEPLQGKVRASEEYRQTCGVFGSKRRLKCSFGGSRKPGLVSRRHCYITCYLLC